MALAKARTSINVKGGGLIKIRELHPTATDAWVDIGYLPKTTISDDHTMMEAGDETGLLIDWIDGNQRVKVTGSIMQSNTAEIGLLKNASGKYYELYYYVLLANGYFQEWLFFGKFKPGFVLEFAAGAIREVPFEFWAFAVPATVTRNPTGWNVTAGDMYVFSEAAAAIAPPVDTAATIATSFGV